MNIDYKFVMDLNDLSECLDPLFAVNEIQEDGGPSISEIVKMIEMMDLIQTRLSMD